MTQTPDDSSRELGQSNALTGLLLDNMTTAVLVEDENRRVIAVNPNYCTLFGIPVEAQALVGADCTKIVEETAKVFVDPEAHLARIDELLSLKEQCPGDEIVMRDGRVLLRKFIPMKQEERLRGFLWQYQDITEDRSNEAQYRAMVSGVLDGVVVADHQGRILEFNEAAETMFGFNREDVLGRRIAEVLVPDDLVDQHSAGMHRYKLAGETKLVGTRVELRAKRKDGSEFPVELSVHVIKEFTPPILMGFIRDITREKAQQRVIEVARQLAESANRAKTQFLAAMSHEIRTPMNGIIGMTELTLDTDLTNQQREYLQMVQSSAGALLSTINSILDFSKIEAGKLELEQIDFTLWETMTGALKPLALAGRMKGIELLYSEGKSVPERLRGDPLRLRQAMTNLVGNAVKFTDSGLVHVLVDVVESNEQRVRLRVQVHDTGIGIAEDKLSHIFGAFDQVDGSMSRRFGGTGLGLSITSGIVELFNGVVEAESQLGRGSTFSFEADFDHAIEDKRPFAPRARDLSGMRVLVVDDYEANCRLLVEYSERLGMTAAIAMSGTEALAALHSAHLQGTPFDVVLLDCHMPEMSGFELAETIREDVRFQNTILIACTAQGEPGDGLRCQQLNIQSYLLRPLAPAELRDAILMTVEKAERPSPELITRHALREARQTLRVLLVEDNRVNQELALHVLKQSGHTVDLATNGLEAVKAVTTQRYDVVLMDVQMPVMDGVEATRRIRQFEKAHGRHTPIVAMTAHAMLGDREEFIAEGMDEYVAKPISRERLRDVLRGIRRQPDKQVGQPPANAPHDLAEARPAPAEESHEVESLPGPLIDHALLEEQTGGDNALLRTLVSVFEEDQPELLRALDVALSTGDTDGVAIAAHTLKGALGVLGAEPVRQLAGAMEQAARDGQHGDCVAGHPLLRDSVLRVTQELRALPQDD